MSIKFKHFFTFTLIAFFGVLNLHAENKLSFLIDGSHAYIDFECDHCKDNDGFCSQPSLMPKGQPDPSQIFGNAPYPLNALLGLLINTEEEEDSRCEIIQFTDGNFVIIDSNGTLLSGTQAANFPNSDSCTASLATIENGVVNFQEESEEDEDLSISDAVMAILALISYELNWVDTKVEGGLHYGDIPIGDKIKKKKTFPLSDEQAALVFDFIQEASKKEKEGTLVYDLMNQNCIDFAQGAYNAARLENTHGDFLSHFTSEQTREKSYENKTIVDYHYINKNGHYTLSYILDRILEEE